MSFEFVIYRILGGLAVGAASVITPAYICEVAPARYRGMLTTLQQIAIIFGLFIAFVSNYLLANYAGASTATFWLDFEAWRWMFWIELFPAGLFLVMLLFIPESPRYLVLRGRVVEAAKVLTRLYGASAASRKLSEIQQSLNVDHQPKLTDLLNPATSADPAAKLGAFQKPGKLRKIVWVGIGLATFQQLVGINVVFYYGAVLWQAVGFSESDALLAARDLYQFDNLFTAPLHGFRDTPDYWSRASAKPVLHQIRVPALALNARNDPFVPAESLPSPQQVGRHVTLWQPAHGGHVGFPSSLGMLGVPGHVRTMPEAVGHWLLAHR